MPNTPVRMMLLTLVACLLCAPGLSLAQQTKERWERVYTGEESVIEMNASSFRLQADHVLRVQFRTILSKAEALQGSQGAKYKSRLETIDFKPNERRYRLFETTLLDANGKELQSYSAGELQEWRAIKAGGVTERLFNAARALSPFGSWKVVAYRSTNGAQASELQDLIGVRVNLQFNRAEVGMSICMSPAYEDRRSSNEELSRALGIDFKSIGIEAENVDAIQIKCEGSGWRPPVSLLIKVRDRELWMLWQGVFLVLK